MSIDVEVPQLGKSTTRLNEIGEWLDNTMPNPPLPEEQIWTIGYSEDGRVGIRFAKERDASLFLIRWSA